MGWHIYRPFSTSRGMPYRYRVSQRRMRRIRLRDNWSVDMWILLFALILLAFMAPRLAWLHYELHHRHAVKTVTSP